MDAPTDAPMWHGIAVMILVFGGVTAVALFSCILAAFLCDKEDRKKNGAEKFRTKPPKSVKTEAQHYAFGVVPPPALTPSYSYPPIPDDCQAGKYLIYAKILHRAYAGDYGEFWFHAGGPFNTLGEVKDSPLNVVLPPRSEDTILGMVVIRTSGSGGYEEVCAIPIKYFNFSSREWPYGGALLTSSKLKTGLTLPLHEVYNTVLTTALVPMSLPEIQITGHGILALREWRFTCGNLASITRADPWGQEQMIADEPPSKQNNNGLYGIEFTDEGLKKYEHILLKSTDGLVIKNHFSAPQKNAAPPSQPIFGLIQIRGKYQIHTDNVIRGEWARIVCLFVPPIFDRTERVVPALIKKYPNVPVYVLHIEQIREVLRRKLIAIKETI